MSEYLVIGGWKGRQKIPVQILSETPEGFWIKARERAMLPGRGIIKRGQRVHVPRTVIKLGKNEIPAVQHRNFLYVNVHALLRRAIDLLRRLQPA